MSPGTEAVRTALQFLKSAAAWSRPSGILSSHVNKRHRATGQQRHCLGHLNTTRCTSRRGCEGLWKMLLTA